MSPDTFNAIVDAASKAAADRLQHRAPATPEQAPLDMEQQAGHVVQRLAVLWGALPELLQALAKTPSALMDGKQERGLGSYVLALALSLMAALAAERVLRWLAAGRRGRLASAAAIREGLPVAIPILSLFALDLLGLGLVALVSYGAVGIWFQGDDAQARLARALMVSIFAWRFYAVVFRAVLRPDEPGARMVPLTDRDAGSIYHSISALILAAISLRALVAIAAALGASANAVGAGRILSGAIMFALLCLAALRGRTAMASWLHSLARYSTGATGWLSSHWLPLAVVLLAAMLAAQIYGVVLEQPQVPQAMLFTWNVIAGLLLLETVAAFLVHRLDAAEEGASTLTALQLRRLHDGRLSSVFIRSLKLALVIGAVALIVQRWAAGVFGMSDQATWTALTRASFHVAATLFGAFVVWQLVKFATWRFVRMPSAFGADEEASEPVVTSRFATIAPLLRIASAILILVVAALVLLAQLGVNITPLIAGASVFGLAVSFGSQTLVRDIVSGIFYLVDDAFRVGEYIDCGKAKGTVEGFTLRSIRLRHQNGQVHTIPFGQLGQITNFSRDWSTVKFNLRLERDADLEKVRKIIKKIGIAMLEDPDLKDDFLQPLKMQGVADVLDNAIVIRLKFTVKPSRPSYIQRLAVRRIIQAFSESGIQFASPTIAVQSRGGAVDPDALAAAAAAAGAQHASASGPSVAS